MIRFHIRGEVIWKSKGIRKSILDSPREFPKPRKPAPMYWYRIKLLGIPTPFIRLIP